MWYNGLPWRLSAVYDCIQNLYVFITYVHQYAYAITIIYNIWILLHIFAASTDIVVKEKKKLPHIIAFNRMWFRKYNCDEKCAISHCRRSVPVSHRTECPQSSILRLHPRWLEKKTLSLWVRDMITNEFEFVELLPSFWMMIWINVNLIFWAQKLALY